MMRLASALLVSGRLLLLVRLSSSLSVPAAPSRTAPVAAAAQPLQAASSAAEKHIVVVGGGVGGLALAARLAASSDKFVSRSQTKVTIVEKNSREMLGGRCGSFDVTVPGYDGAFRHERGPSLLLLKSVYEELFLDCTGGSKTAHDFGLDMEQCVPAYQVVFDDGDRIELGFPHGSNSDTAGTKSDDIDMRISKKEQLSIDKMNSYEVDGYQKWKEYMAACSAFLDCGLPNFIEERLDLPSFPAFLYQALREKGKAWPLKPHSDVLDAIFDSEKMKAMASFQDLYVGLEPYKNEKGLFGGVMKKTAPAVFGLLAALELHPTNSKAGVFAPLGGFRAVSEAFEQLCTELGVEILCDTTVTQIQDDGVHILQGESADFISADTIVVNADLPYAKTSLFPAQNSNKKAIDSFDWDDSFDFSSGVVAFHWSLDVKLDDLNTHNVFISASYRDDAIKSWNAVRNNVQSKFGDDPFNFYVHRASETDTSAAPEGCDSIMVLVPTETLSRNKEYAKLSKAEAIEQYTKQFDEEYIERIRSTVLKRLGAVESLKNLEKHIIDEVVDTPASYADSYNLAAGTPFALSHGFAQLSLTRPSPRSNRHKNVFYVGASTRPGNGVPLVLLGAKAISNQVAKAMSTMEAIEN